MNDEMEDGDVEIEMVADEEGQAQDLAKRISRLKEKLAKCEEERKANLDGWQRTKADHANYKKDEAKRLEDTARFVAAGFLQDLLPVLDSFELALKSFRSGEGKQSVHEQGVLMIRSQMMDVLKKRGIVPIPVAPGEKFDPARHEAIGEAESEHPAGTVAEEVQRGYMHGERVARPARVRIAKEK